MELYSLTIKEAAEKLEKGEISSVELTKAILERIKEVDPKVGAYITVTEKEALEMAIKSDERRKAGKTLSQLDGIPVAVKDLFLTKGVRTTAASKILDDFIPAYESTVTKKLWESGAVLLGKANLDQFAMGSSTETSAYKTATEFDSTTRNPWDLERIPGGSSGGSAAAVAADLCVGAVGTDTGGSIRQPASHCGIVGIKPTYGRVSRYGTMAMASSLDQAGPMTKTVEDAAIMLEAISGFDKFDSTSSDKAVPEYSKQLNSDIKGIKVGLPKEFFGEGLDEDIKKTVLDSVKQLEKLGASIVDVSMPMLHYALAVYYILMPAEVSSNLARYDGIRYGYSILKQPPFCHPKPTQVVPYLIRDLHLVSGSKELDSGSQASVRNDNISLEEVYKLSRAEGFGDEAKRRIMLGSYVLSAGYYDAYYKKALKVRRLIKEEFENMFKSVDILITPVSPMPAFKMSEKSDDPMAMYLSDIMTVPVNPAGVPAMSIPSGFVKRDGNDLPVGMQIIGPHWSEQTLLNVGYAYQKVTDHHKRKPKI